MIRLLLILALALAALPARADGVREVEETYAISGATGRALYESIGERGPKVGKSRAIALTGFELRWKRDYQRNGNACVLAAATPTVTITTTLPEPAESLPADAAARWRDFIAGIRAHEAVHGEFIHALVDDIIGATLGLSEDNDPGCKALKAEVLKRQKGAMARYNKKNAAFERKEMAAGGPVRKLVLALIGQNPFPF